MPAEGDERELEELKALMARNAEAVEKLRRMVEQMEFMLAAMSRAKESGKGDADDQSGSSAKP